MAFRIHQDNFEKAPTSEQRKVLDLLGNTVGSLTRIQAHLRIREMLKQDPQLKRRLIVWRQEREAARTRRRADAQPG